MLFMRVDLDYPQSRDLVGEPLAKLLYLYILAYAQKYERDGEIKKSELPAVAFDIPQPKKHLELLVKCGKLEATSAGWTIPPSVWAEWNPTRQELDRERGKKSTAGVKGNHARWHDAENPNPNCNHCMSAGWIAEDIAGAIAGATDVRSQNDRKTIAIPQTVDRRPSLSDNSKSSSKRGGSTTGQPNRAPVDNSQPKIIDIASHAKGLAS